MRRHYSTIFVFVLAATFPAGLVNAQTAGQQAEEPQEAEFGTFYRRHGGVDEQTIRDMQAQGEIYKTLVEKTDIDPGPIHVRVKNGQVTLTGQVSTQQEREVVTEVARDTHDVVSVTNRLEVGGHS